MKTKSVSLDSILARELKGDAFRLLFDERRFYLQIAHLISDLRASSEMSQAVLAKRAGISQPMVARLEKGDPLRVPTFDTIARVLHALGYTMSINVQKEKKRKAA